jgi:hypothetical protein
MTTVHHNIYKAKSKGNQNKSDDQFLLNGAVLETTIGISVRGISVRGIRGGAVPKRIGQTARFF